MLIMYILLLSTTAITLLLIYYVLFHVHENEFERKLEIASLRTINSNMLLKINDMKNIARTLSYINKKEAELTDCQKECIKNLYKEIDKMCKSIYSHHARVVQSLLELNTELKTSNIKFASDKQKQSILNLVVQKGLYLDNQVGDQWNLVSEEGCKYIVYADGSVQLPLFGEKNNVGE